MVTTVNATLDDDVAERIKSVKDDLGLTWAEFLEEAADCLTDTSEPASGPATPREPATSPAPMPDRDVDTDALREALPGGGADLDGRVNAVMVMYDYLRTHGEAEKQELLDVVDVDATGYDSAESFWSNAVKARDTLRALPGVEPPASGQSTWRYREP